MGKRSAIVSTTSPSGDSFIDSGKVSDWLVRPVSLLPGDFGAQKKIQNILRNFDVPG
ncbi:hypothetical protein [Shinella sp.]|uniref:hypothetical protein n=1 Tax=Shinella sp. TaxID=1870904 RepID=UPI0028ABC2C0|nr:hypothetical protein [Shinella sp.]